jgi:hypothetical protein
MRVRLVVPLLLAVIVFRVSAVSGLTWSNGGNGANAFGTHDWVREEANDLAVAQGVTQVYLDATLPRTSPRVVAAT